MSPTWQRVLIAGGGAVGLAIVTLLAVIAYALLSGDGPGADVARITQTATASPTATATPRPTPSPAPPTATPEATPQPTQEPTQEAPPPPAVVQEPAPIPVEQQPPPTQEPPPPPRTEEPPSPTPPPTPPPPTPAPTATPSPELVQACSNARASAELYGIVVDNAALHGLSSTDLGQQVQQELTRAQTFVATNCQGLGLTPLPSEGLLANCSLAGQLKGMLEGHQDSASQQSLGRLNAYTSKYCGY